MRFSCRLHGRATLISYDTAECPMCLLESETVEVRELIRKAQVREWKESMRLPVNITISEVGGTSV